MSGLSFVVMMVSYCRPVVEFAGAAGNQPLKPAARSAPYETS